MNEQQVRQFKQDGFWIDRGVFSDEQLQRLRRVAGEVKDRAIEMGISGLRYWDKGLDRDSLTPTEKGLSTWGIGRITRPPLCEMELVNAFAHPRVSDALNAMVDQPRAWAIKILWTPKMVGYDLGWHRDQVGKELYDRVHLKPAAQDHVQFNAALNEDSAFRVVPGSHRRPLTETEWDAVNNAPIAELPGEVVAELEAGDILYMDAHALHRGKCDMSDNRLTLHYSVQAQRIPLQPWGTDEEWAFITSEEFIDRLEPAAKPLYQRLRTAERTEDKMGWLKKELAAAG